MNRKKNKLRLNKQKGEESLETGTLHEGSTTGFRLGRFKLGKDTLLLFFRVTLGTLDAIGLAAAARLVRRNRLGNRLGR